MTITRGDVEAWFPFQRDARDIIKTNDGSVNGASLVTDAPFDNLIGSYTFDSSNSDSIDISDDIFGDVTSGGFAVSCWFKTDGTSSDSPKPPLVNIWPGGSSSSYIAIALDDGGSNDDQLILRYRDNSGDDFYEFYSGNTFADDNWHHVVGVWDIDNTEVEMYVDGVSQGTQQQSELSNGFEFATENATTGIGKYTNASASINAEISQTSFINRVPTSTEVNNLYNGGSGVTARGQFPLTDNLEAYYKFDGNADDATGNGNDGTVNGATTTSPGRIGDAYSFNGISDNIDFTNSTYPTGDSAFTISFWFRTSSTQDGWMFTFGNDATDERVGIILQSVGNVRYFSFGSTNLDVTPSSSYADGNWHYVALTYDPNQSSDNWRAFYDGELVNTATESGINITINDITAGYRAQDNSNYFSGEMDELEVLSRPFSDGEIRRQYSYGAGLRYEDLDKEHPLNDGVVASFTHDSSDVSGNTLSDAKNGTYDATIGAGITSGTSGLINESQEAFGGGQTGTTDQFVETGYTFDETPTGFTIGTYMNLDQKPSNERYSLAGAQGDNSGTGGDLNLTVEDEYEFNGLLWKTRLGHTNYGAIVYDMSNVDTGQWKSVVATYDDTNGYELYYAGSSVGTNNDTTWGAPTDGSSLSLFAFEQGDGTHLQAFEGRLDGSTVWVRELSVTEANEFDNDGNGQQFPYELQTDITAITQSFNYQFTSQVITALPGTTAQPLDYTYTAQPSTISVITTASPFNYRYYQAVEPVRLFGAAGNIIITGRNT